MRSARSCFLRARCIRHIYWNCRELETVSAFASEPGLRAVIVRAVRPGPETADDLELTNYVRRKGETAWHPVGTCRMGSDPLAVVATLRPDLFDIRRASVAVETEAEARYGRTTADYGRGSVDVVLDVDAPAAKRLVVGLLRGGA